MNDLGRILLVAAARVSLFAGLAAFVCAGIFRRRPAAAARAATVGLAGCLVLTATSLCPLPAWWSWERAWPTASAEVTVASAVAANTKATESVGSDPPSAPAAGGGLVWPAVRLRDVRERIKQIFLAAPAPGTSATAVVVGCLLAAVTCGLGRFLFGLLAVRRYRRASEPITDTRFQWLCTALQAELHCRRRVEARECPALGGPATVGWLRPTLLLPAGWQEWDDGELRAVLAHELAHVCRGDFAARLVAGLGVALHLYNPLLHWLAAHLLVQQELAADALAAAHAGGRARYLRALARLALRLDGAAPAWPARAFLSSPRTLMRRIQMLKTKDGRTDRPALRRVLTAGLLAAVAGVSALRSPAREAPPPDAKPQATRGTADNVKADADEIVLTPGHGEQRIIADEIVLGAPPGAAEPFDLTYVPADAQGILCYRPARFFARPGMDKLAARANEGLQGVIALLGARGKLALRVEDVDWVLSPVLFQRPSGDPNARASVQASLRAIRTVKDFDWLQQMKVLAPSLQEVRDGTHTYYRIPKDALPGVPGKIELTFVVPDRRTILFDTRVPDGPRRLPAWFPNSVWGSVAGGDLAVAIDCHNLAWLPDYARKSPDLDPRLAEIVAGARSLVFGVDAGDTAAFHAHALVDSMKQCEGIRRAVAALFANVRRDAKATGTPPAVARFLTDLADESSFAVLESKKEVIFSWSSSVNVNLPELLPALLAAEHLAEPDTAKP